MTEEKKVQYFNIILCKTGMLLVGLGLIRALSVYQDQLSFLLGFIGYSLFSLHVRALEKSGTFRKSMYGSATESSYFCWWRLPIGSLFRPYNKRNWGT